MIKFGTILLFILILDTSAIIHQSPCCYVVTTSKIGLQLCNLPGGGFGLNDGNLFLNPEGFLRGLDTCSPESCLLFMKPITTITIAIMAMIPTTMPTIAPVASPVSEVLVSALVFTGSNQGEDVCLFALTYPR